jgi:hypothetical protein
MATPRKHTKTMTVLASLVPGSMRQRLPHFLHDAPWDAGEQLESIFIGSYLGAIKAAAAAGTAFIAEAAAQIVGIECEHRVLIRDIAGEDPPNDRWFESDITSPNSTVGSSSTRSTVYATGADAVNALLALGITPSTSC